MEAPPKIRRQRPGIRAEQTTVTLPGDEMTRLRKEAYKKGMTVSMHVVDLIRKAWGKSADAAPTELVAPDSDAA